MIRRRRRLDSDRHAHREALGVEFSPEAVVSLFADAERGDAKAQWIVGRFYRDGLAGVPRDVSLADKWLRRAAEAGVVGAQLDLANIFSKSPGPGDLAAAAGLYRAAASSGHRVAQRHIGTMYWDGTGVEQDRKEAVRWWLQAAAQGDNAAKYNLAPLLWRGGLVQRDRIKALRYLLDAVSDEVVVSRLEERDRTESRRRRAASLLLVSVIVLLCIAILILK